MFFMMSSPIETTASAPTMRTVSSKFTFTYLALAAITFFAILARLYVRVYLRYDVCRWSSWRWSDRLLISTWIGFTSCGIMNLALHLSSDPGAIRQANLLHAYTVTFWVWVFVVKGAWLCFYDEFISKRYHYKYWLAVRATGFLLAFGGVTTLIYSNIWCLPFSRHLSDGLDACDLDTVASSRWVYYRQVWHAGTDVLILAIPLALLPSLRRAVPLRSRIGAAIMFLVGLLCTVTSCVYLAYCVRYNEYPPHVRCFLEYEPVVELAAAMLIQCAPAFRVMAVPERRRSVARGMASPTRISLRPILPQPEVAAPITEERGGNVRDEEEVLKLDVTDLTVPGRVLRPPKVWQPPSSWEVRQGNTASMITEAFNIPR